MVSEKWLQGKIMSKRAGVEIGASGSILCAVSLLETKQFLEGLTVRLAELVVKRDWLKVPVVSVFLHSRCSQWGSQVLDSAVPKLLWCPTDVSVSH